jgi:hypothetical protein
MSIKIRSGKTTDSNWIESLLRDGSRVGHFGPTVANQANTLLNEIFQRGGFQILKLREGIQTPAFVQASILVVELNGVPASFSITLDEGSEIELHLAGTIKTYQRNGCFLALVEQIKNQKGQKRLFARCYKKSTWATAALTKAGFKITKQGDPVELTF